MGACDSKAMCHCIFKYRTGKKMNSMFEKNMVLMVGPKNIKIELLKFYNISRPFGLYSTAMKIDKYSFHVC